MSEIISVARLDRQLQIFADIKKSWTYNKTDGKWYWHDRDEESNLHGPFNTFVAMVDDAVAPYEEEDEG